MGQAHVAVVEDNRSRRLLRWLPAFIFLAIAADLFSSGQVVFGLVMVIGVLAVLPTSSAHDRLLLASVRWAAIGITVIAAAIAFYLNANWGAGSVFLCLSAFPLGFAAYVYHGRKQSGE